MSRVVGNVHGHMILCHMVLTRDPVMTIFGELIMCVQVVVTFMHVRQVSVLPPGIDVRKLQRSHRAVIRFTKPSFFSVYLSGLPIRFSVFTQTLSDLTLDWSKVRSDKLICVNTALGQLGLGKNNDEFVQLGYIICRETLTGKLI